MGFFFQKEVTKKKNYQKGWLEKYLSKEGVLADIDERES